jgi:hypothetical protein
MVDISSLFCSRVADLTEVSISHVMGGWDFLARGGTLVAVLSRVGSTGNDTEMPLFRRWWATVQARQEELPEDSLCESAPPMQLRLIWAMKKAPAQ